MIIHFSELAQARVMIPIEPEKFREYKAWYPSVWGYTQK